jgi:hypothetical protein
MRKKSRPWRDPATAELLDELGALYRDVDAAYAGHRCPGTSECCHFAVTGREPFVTSIELLAVERAVAAAGGPPSPRRRALPIVAGADERICPLLTSDGRCSIYAWRPLGCRSFWCHRADVPEPVRQPELNDMVRRVKDLGARHRHGGDVGRPLYRALQELLPHP